MTSIKNDCTVSEINNDYENCGKFGFSNKLLQGVVCPCVDFPSLNWLNVIKFDVTEKFVNKVAFKQNLALIPSTIEDTSGSDFENWIYQFASS